MLDEMSLLPERLLAHLAPERFLARVRAKMHLDVALVQESAVAYVTVVHCPLPGHVSVRTVDHRAPSGHASSSTSASTATAATLGLAAPVPRLFRGHVRSLTGRGGVREFGRRPRTVDGRGRSSGCSGCGGGRGGRHVTAQVRGADHVTGGAVRQVRRGGRRWRRRAVHVIAAGVLERRLVGRTVLQPALEQRHERRGGRARRGWRHVGRHQLAGLLLLVQRFLLHGGWRRLVISSRATTTSIRHSRKL